MTDAEKEQLRHGDRVVWHSRGGEPDVQGTVIKVVRFVDGVETELHHIDAGRLEKLS